MESTYQVLLVAAALLLCYHLYSQYKSGQAIPNYGQLQEDEAEVARVQAMPDHPQVEDLRADNSAEQKIKEDRVHGYNSEVLAPPQPSNTYASVPGSDNSNYAQLGCFPKDQIAAADLLPKEGARNEWTDVNPEAPGNLSYRNFLEAGHHYGVDTVGQSRGYPNMQLRSDPLIPRKEVGPWHQTTNEPDTNRRHFDIGGC